MRGLNRHQRRQLVIGHETHNFISTSLFILFPFIQLDMLHAVRINSTVCLPLA